MSGVPRRLRLGILGMGSVAQAVHLPLLARRSDLEQVVLHAIGDRYGIAAIGASPAP